MRCLKGYKFLPDHHYWENRLILLKKDEFSPAVQKSRKEQIRIHGI